MVATVASFVTPFMGSSVNIALPVMGRHFDLTAEILSWVNTAYLLAAGMFLLPMGKLADIYGRKKVFLVGTVVYTISSGLIALSDTAFFLLLFRIVQGAGSAMIFGTGLAILTSVYGPGERGRALGITIAAVYTGLSCGPVLGGWMTEALGWQSIFWVNIPLGLLIIVCVLWKLHGEWKGAEGERFDYLGALVFMIALPLLIYGLSKTPTPQGMWLAAAGLLGIALFVAWEAAARAPLIQVRLFRHNIVFAMSNLAALLNYSALFAVTYLMSLYLQYIRGFEPRHAGLILVAQPVMMAVFSPFTGKMSDRVEPRIVSSAGMLCITISLVLLSGLNADTHLAFVIGSLLFLGTGMALFSSPNTNAIMSSVDHHLLGVAAATVSTMRLIGQMLSMATATLIITWYVGRQAITPETHDALLKSTRISFRIFAVLCLIGVFASLARGKMRDAGRVSSTGRQESP
ncbi:MFS transporter [bacterium]|nr:MFS transporter [bacterium]